MSFFLTIRLTTRALQAVRQAGTTTVLTLDIVMHATKIVKHVLPIHRLAKVVIMVSTSSKANVDPPARLHILLTIPLINVKIALFIVST